MTMNKIFSKLRNFNKGNYILLVFCVSLAVTMISSFSLILYCDAVQNTLPIGGDSRKQIYMIFVIVLIGNLIFTIYAAGLFFKFKSKETGVLLALGAKKSKLSKILLQEMILILSACIGIGLLLSSILAPLLWQLLRIFGLDNRDMPYNYAFEGFGIGFLFGLVVSICILFMTYRYMKRSNLMDILNDQRISEPIKEVPKSYCISGIILLAAGLVGGYGSNIFFAYILKRQAPSLLYGLYLLALVGTYRLITYAVVHNEKGHNQAKYYKNIISNSIMKFTGKQTVRNMCVIAFLIAASLFSCFYVSSLVSGLIISTNDLSYDFTFRYELSEDEITNADIEELADRYHIDITTYKEDTFSKLIGNTIERDYNDDTSKLIEVYIEQSQYFEFMSETIYENLTGKKMDVPTGSYTIIIGSNESENIWFGFDDLDTITNPVTGDTYSLSFGETVVCDELTIMGHGVNRYILNDDDYARMTAGLPLDKQIRLLMFNVNETENTVDYANELYELFLAKASDNMAVTYEYDELIEKRELEKSNDYTYYTTNLDLTSDNPSIINWKYYPSIKALNFSNTLNQMAVFLILFVYAALISLAAVGIISYSRSITLGINNKQLFMDLRKLGANNKYISKCITKQLTKIYLVPTIIGAILILAFTLVTLWGNSSGLEFSEIISLLVDLAILANICVYQYIVYRVSLKKIKKLVGIH